MSQSFSARVEAEGHLIDSGLMSRMLACILENGGNYTILRFDVGHRAEDVSQAELELRHEDSEGLQKILDNLSALGARVQGREDARLSPAPKDGVAPNGFYSTTNQRTQVRWKGRWTAVEQQRMDAVLVIDGARVTCKKIRDLRAGENVVCGHLGVRIEPEYHARTASDFAFMDNEVSSERAVRVRIAQVARWAREARAEQKSIVVVAGPVVVHTGGAEHLEALIRAGWVDHLLSGNALAVHDCERALFGTSLGVSLETGVPVAEGHMHHMRAINAIRAAGSLAAAVEQSVLKSGVMHACIEAGVPFVLAGSIRDDGPLPDTEMDLIRAQEAYARALENAGLVLILSSMLHGIGVGNMLPAWVRTVCVDIHSAVVTKLNDRGSSQASGIVTDVGLFLDVLRRELLA